MYDLKKNYIFKMQLEFITYGNKTFLLNVYIPASKPLVLILSVNIGSRFRK